MTSVLRNSIIAEVESTHEGTLFDPRRILIEPVFRHDAEGHNWSSGGIFLGEEFSLLTGMPQILTRVDSFLRPEQVRNIVAQKEILNTGKIFLTKRAQVRPNANHIRVTHSAFAR